MISSSQRRTSRLVDVLKHLVARIRLRVLWGTSGSRGIVGLLTLAVILLSSVVTTFAAPPTAPQAVFVVSNSGGGHINEYTTTGELLRTLSGGPASSIYRGIVFGADGYLYVTNTLGCGSNGCGNELEKYDPNTGTYLGSVGYFTGPATSSTGLTLGLNSTLYVTTNQLGLYQIDPMTGITTAITTADCCTGGVAFLLDGTPLSISGSRNTVNNDLTGAAFNTGFFISAQAIAFGPSGQLYVLEDNQIDTVPGKGGAIIPLTASNALSAGSFLTFDSQGNMWVTDTNYGVREFSSVTGTQIGGFTSNLASGFAGIAVGPLVGNVWSWGDDSVGELGNGSYTESNLPVQVGNLSNVTTIAGGNGNSLALKSDGTVWTWGNNSFGQLGNGTTTTTNVPNQIALAGVAAIAAGDFHSLALKSDGTVWTWGSNQYGQLGDSTTTNRNTPVQVSGLTGVVAISGGTFHSLAVKSDGTVWAWGDNSFGQLGIGTSGIRTGSALPVQVTGLSGAIAVAAGKGHSVALKSDGTVWAWGDNTSNDLGSANLSSNVSIPVQVSNLANIQAIAANSNYGLALKSDGTVWAWGDNSSGQLGIGNAQPPTPVQINTLSGMTAISAGVAHGFALRNDGTVWAWGDNLFGELGNNSTTSSFSPIQVRNLSGVFAIAGGYYYSMALRTAAPSPATHFNVSVPASVTAGTAFNITVTALDASNATAAAYTGTVQFTSSDGAAVLPANYTFTAADNGTHTFSATLNTASSQTISAADTANNTIAGTTGAITVSAPPATHFAVSAPASVAGGTPFSITVVAQDAANNNTTNYTGTVHFTSSDSGATLPSDYTFMAADRGAHTFTMTLNTVGNQTIIATDTANSTISGISNAINVISPSPPTPVQITDNETITVSDVESSPDVFDAEAVHFTDAVFVTPIIQVGAPVVSFSAGALGFGGQSGLQTITVSDIGQAPLTLASATISGSSQFTITQIACTNGSLSVPVTLPVGGVCTFTINYVASATPTNDNATLVFADNGALSNLVSTASGSSYAQSVPLGGSGAATLPPPPPPAVVQVMDNETIRVTDSESFPDVFDAEAVHVTDAVFVTPIIKVGAPVVSFSAGAVGFNGQSGTQTIAASDIGQAPLTLASATISGSSQFTITQITCTNGTISLSVTLPVGGVCTFTIKYVASATPANDNATLVFTDNAALSDLVSMRSGSNYAQSVSLSGSGTTTPPPPPPPATVSLVDNETISVTDTSSFPDVFDAEKIAVMDQITITVLNTSAGSGINVIPVDTTNGTSPVSLTFSQVTQPGTTGLTTTSTGPTAPSGFQLGNPGVYYNISTTASYTGSVTVCINYSGISFTRPPQLFHYGNGAWMNITTSVNTAAMVVCGTTTSFSPFSLFQQSTFPTTTSITAPGVTYGTPASVTVSAASLGGTVTGNVSLSVDGGSASTMTLSNGSTSFSLVGLSAGSHSLSASFATQGNFVASSSVGTLFIAQAPLAIAARSAARPYGANNPLLIGTILGLQNADAITANFTTIAMPTSPIGAYAIIPVVIDPQNRLSNYSLSLVNGTLTVMPEATSLSVTVSPTSIPVGQSTVITVTLTAPDMVIPIDPSVLAPITVTSPIVSDILTNNGICTLVPGSAPGTATCSVTLTAVEPNGRTLVANFAGSSALVASTNTADLVVTAPLETKVSCIHSDFRNVAVTGGSYLWFNSIFRVHDVTKQKITLTFFQSSVQFQYTDATGKVIQVNQPVPDAKIVIDPGVSSASTTFDFVNNVWITTIPFDLDDNAFLTGLPWLVPSGGLPADVEPVTWCGTFASDTAGVDIGWRWAAAAYSSFSGDNSILGVKPMNTDHDNSSSNHDNAGTPENFKPLVIPGARGKGGRNYTGSYSGSAFLE